MQTALDYDAVPENSVIVNPTSKKDEGRPDVFKGRIAKQRPDIAVVGLEVAVEPVTGGGAELSATGMREAINNNNFEEYKEYIPERSLNKAEYIWEKILGRELPVDELDATELNEMIKEGLKDTIKKTLKEVWADHDRNYQMDREDEREGENLSSDKAAARLADIAASHPIVSNFSPKTYDMFEKQIEHEIRVNGLQGQEAIDTALRIVRNLTTISDDLEEASSMGNGAVQGSMRAPAKRDEEDTLIREVYNYLMQKEIIKDL